MTDATIDLERDYAEAATARQWFNIAFRGSVTSFRDRDIANEYAARIKIRWAVNVLVYATDTVPGYEH